MNTWGVKERILVITLLPALIIALLLVIYFTNTQLSNIEQAMLERGRTLTGYLARSSEFGLFSGNRPALKTLSNVADAERDITAVAILDVDGNVVVESGRPLDVTNLPLDAHSLKQEKGGQFTLFTTPVYQSDLPLDDFVAKELQALDEQTEPPPQLGWVAVQFSNASLIEQRQSAMANAFLITLACVAIAGVLAYRLGTGLSTPIIDLTRAVDQIEKGELSTRVHERSNHELGRLEHGVNSMADSLQKAYGEMEQRIDEKTVHLRESLETLGEKNRELEEARQQALSASRTKSEFLANMSHEIRTPLNAIIGFLRLLDNTELDGTQKRYIETVQRSANSLLTIINDILDFSKIEAGKLVFQNIPFDIHEVFDDVFSLLAPEGHEKGLEIASLVYSDVPTQLVGDPNRIKQVVINLVSNAIKFTKHGEVVVRTMIEEETDNDAMIRIAVTDTGIGIGNDEVQHLFKAFSQVDTTPSRPFKGTGLGLAITKNLVDRMGGQIGLESQKGQGSTFWVTFRCQKNRRATPTPTTFEGYRALTYDTHELAGLSIQHLLSQWGIEVLRMTDWDAFEKAAAAASAPDQTFDLIVAGLSDLKNLDTRLRQLGHLGAETDAKSMVLVSSSEPEVVDKVFHAGIDECLSKPPRVSELYDKVERLLFGSHRPDSAQADSILPTSKAWQGRHLLLAEDNPINQTLLRTMLEDEGVDVTLVENGRDAIAAVRETAFDAVLMDVHMPEVNGVEAAQAIRQLPSPYGDVPIIGVSADVFSSQSEEYWNAGMNDYLIKPLDENQLHRILNKWFGQQPEASSTRTAETDPPETPSAIDWEAGLARARGNPDLARKLFTMFREDLPDQARQINQATAAADYKRLFEVVHKVHGSCAYCGVPLLAAVTSKLERAIQEGDHEAIPGLVETFGQEVERFQAEATRLDQGTQNKG